MGHASLGTNDTELQTSIDSLPPPNTNLSDDPLMSEVRTARLPDNLFRIPEPSTSKRAEIPYHLFYSQSNISISLERPQERLYATATLASGLRALLELAVRRGAGADAQDFRTSFNVSSHNLILIMNAIDSSSERPTFTWKAFSSVAQILLDATEPTGNALTPSWVGVVRNPSNKTMASLAVLPYFIVETRPPSTASPASISSVVPMSRPIPSTVAPTNKAPILHDDGLKLVRRDVYDVAGTALRVIITVGRHRLPGAFLEDLIDSAYSMVQMANQAGSEYHSVYMQNPVDHRNNVFQFNTVNGQVIPAQVMRNIMTRISVVAIQYLLNHFGDTDFRPVYSLQGQVVDAFGTVVAAWFLGGPEGQLGEVLESYRCPHVQVVQPDGQIVCGCLVRSEG
ncbi:MAG: hypothetical protein M1817_001244 [Caeruleum heppii]|nr:MAG: hypothetical protein M1817_001244 [Caeruleum heppii]